MSPERHLDVSELPPPEPLERALAAVQRLGLGEYLRMTHRREPCLLFPVLEQNGFAWRIRREGSGAYEIFIWRERDCQARDAVDRVMSR
jgi:hypothetical protein